MLNYRTAIGIQSEKQRRMLTEQKRDELRHEARTRRIEGFDPVGFLVGKLRSIAEVTSLKDRAVE